MDADLIDSDGCRPSGRAVRLAAPRGVHEVQAKGHDGPWLQANKGQLLLLPQEALNPMLKERSSFQAPKAAMERASYQHVVVGEPVRHRRKPVPFSPRFVVSRETAIALQEIHRLDDELDRYVLRARDYMALVEKAWGSNFHASTALEGNPLSRAEVGQVTAQTLGGGPEQSADPYRQEVINHLFVWLAPDALSLPWTSRLIRVLHQFLMAGVAPEAWPGRFSDLQMEVIHRATGVPIFYGAPAQSIASEMDDFMLWVNGQSPALHPVVAAAIAFHEFESIHPFKDGNGRVGRVLFHSYLQNAGLRNAHLCLIESTLLRDADLYYRILAWTDDRLDYTELIRYFTEAVLESYSAARDELAAQDLLTKGMDEHRRRILVEAKRRRGWFSAQQAGQWTDGVVHTTVLKHLNALVEEDVLEASGETRGRRYRFKSPFHAVEEMQAERLAAIRTRFQAAKGPEKPRG